jgi:hypothetical protein
MDGPKDTYKKSSIFPWSKEEVLEVTNDRLDAGDERAATKVLAAGMDLISLGDVEEFGEDMFNDFMLNIELRSQSSVEASAVERGDLVALSSTLCYQIIVKHCLGEISEVDVLLNKVRDCVESLIKDGDQAEANAIFERLAKVDASYARRVCSQKAEVVTIDDSASASAESGASALSGCAAGFDESAGDHVDFE